MFKSVLRYTSCPWLEVYSGNSIWYISEINTQLLPRKIWKICFFLSQNVMPVFKYPASGDDNGQIMVYEPIRDFHQALHLGAPELLRNRPLDFWRMIPGTWSSRPSRPHLHSWSMVTWSLEGVLTSLSWLHLMPAPTPDGNCWSAQIMGIGWIVMD